MAEAFAKALAGESGGLTAEQQACIDKVITKENVRESFVAGFTGKVLADDPLAAAGECSTRTDQHQILSPALDADHLPLRSVRKDHP